MSIFYILSPVQTGSVWRSKAMKYFFVIKHCLVCTYCLIVFDRMWTTSHIWSNIAKNNLFCSFKHVWYRLTTQWNIKMFGHQRIFDRVWSPNLSCLDRAEECDFIRGVNVVELISLIFVINVLEFCLVTTLLYTYTGKNWPKDLYR